LNLLRVTRGKLLSLIELGGFWHLQLVGVSFYIETNLPFDGRHDARATEDLHGKGQKALG
jgi:hypothetical protein